MKMKISRSEAKEIRDLHDSGVMSRAKLAEKFKVSVATIYAIVRNSTFYDRNYKPVYKVPVNSRYCKKLRDNGETLSRITALEGLKSKRDKPLSIETVRRAIFKAGQDDE